MGDGEVYTQWAAFPAGFIDPLTEHNIPSDETLVRTIMNSVVLLDSEVGTFATSPLYFTIGLIAFDGGSSPDYWDGQSISAAEAVQPPRPFRDGDEDWILRQPFIFVNGNSYQGPDALPFIESKAMRKLPPGKGVLLVAEYTDFFATYGAATWTMGTDIRMALRSGYTA